MSEILQLLLETVIKVLLPVALGYLVVFINAKIKEAKASTYAADIATAAALIYQLVLAAEQNGLIEAIKNEGAEKKRYVLDLAEKHKDCFFMAYTNSTLITDAVSARLRRVPASAPTRAASKPYSMAVTPSSVPATLKSMSP